MGLMVAKYIGEWFIIKSKWKSQCAFSQMSPFVWFVAADKVFQLGDDFA